MEATWMRSVTSVYCLHPLESLCCLGICGIRTRKHVVFGKLILGQDTLKKIEQAEVKDTKPVVPVKIVDWDEIHETKYHSMVLPVPENDKKKSSKSKSGKEICSVADNHEARRKGHHKTPVKGQREKKHRR